LSEFVNLPVEPIINAAGTLTRLSASPMSPDVCAAMAEAARHCVDIAELQGVASHVIAQCTGAEAGIVTSGATAGLLLGAAACMAGFDPARMSALPQTEGIPNEFIVARTHRNSYDHGVRASGARLVEVGFADRVTEVGACDTEAWEYAAAIGPRTAGVFYVARAGSESELRSVAEVAHDARLPVLVDAAAELPPVTNLRRFIALGADLVAFSGGKGIGGPSASGILCGKADLVGSALLQQLDLDYRWELWNPPPHLIDKRKLRGVPRHGIGRACKVGKEQIVGLLVALQRFAAEDDAQRNARFGAIVDALEALIPGHPGLAPRRAVDGANVPVLELEVSAAAGLSALELANRLAGQRPAIYVDAMRAEEGVLVLVPTCLTAQHATAIGAALRQVLDPSSR
jgi:D-glucosaminate-6-phosphate ammonia-lyase